jgi:hypothetical protein
LRSFLGVGENGENIFSPVARWLAKKERVLKDSLSINPVRVRQPWGGASMTPDQLTAALASSLRALVAQLDQISGFTTPTQQAELRTARMLLAEHDRQAANKSLSGPENAAGGQL